MTSAIDATRPIQGAATTQSVRDNFAAAKAEIEALQAIPPGSVRPDWANATLAASHGGQYGGAADNVDYAVPANGMLFVITSGGVSTNNRYTGWIRINNAGVGGQMDTLPIVADDWYEARQAYRVQSAPVAGGQHVTINGEVSLVILSGTTYGYGFSVYFVPWATT